MAYEIKKSNGDTAAIVLDGTTVNTKFDITLIGKNYAGYGVPQNENFLHLLENFCKGTHPDYATTGQLWYDSSTTRLKLNTGSSALPNWHTISLIESTNTEPTNLTVGNFWWNTTYGHLYCKTATGKEFIGGSSTGRPTQMKTRTVTDNADGTHDIIEAVVGNQTVFTIYNGTSPFTLKGNADNTITGFTSINPGFTSKDLSGTYRSSVYKFWGTATDSDKLAGNDASTYISTSSPFFADIGLTIGNTTANKKLYIYNYIAGSVVTPIIENKIDNKIVFKTTVSSVSKTALEINGADLLPGSTGVSNIGADGVGFNNVYAAAFKGNADSATQLKVNTVARSADESATSGTIVARTSTTGTFLKIGLVATENTTTFTVSNSHVVGGAVTFTVTSKAGVVLGTYNGLLSGTDTVTLTSGATTGFVTGCEVKQTSIAGGATPGQFGSLAIPVGSIRAAYFVGIATTAGGDVAEKYVADATYEVGSVLMIGGEKEVTAAKYGKRAIGAISVNPSVIMNHELQNGTLVGIKGRVPVNVVGPVTKGDQLIATDTGAAIALSNPLDAWLVFAIALEDNSIATIKIVEAVIL
jgi:hypothetical protein